MSPSPFPTTDLSNPRSSPPSSALYFSGVLPTADLLFSLLAGFWRLHRGGRSWDVSDRECAFGRLQGAETLRVRGGRAPGDPAVAPWRAAPGWGLGGTPEGRGWMPGPGTHLGVRSHPARAPAGGSRPMSLSHQRFSVCLPPTPSTLSKEIMEKMSPGGD